ncbi:MAG: hypothetical protein P1V36_04925 [Planctomycetota bacterium]|nr:hypothetical protein [Planctomycetota bacterium]
MKLLKILGGLVVLLVLVLLVVGFFIDGIAQSAIETAATEALGVSTTVDSCHVGLLRGTFRMEGLKVANPKGYGDAPFLRLRSGGIEVAAATLADEKVEVPEFTLDGIRLGLIQNAQGSNYGTILDNLDRFGKSDASTEGEGKRFVIKKLVITDVVVSVVPVPELKLGALDLPLERIELTDVGSDTEKGVLLSELSSIVVQEILQRATSSGQLPAMIQGALGGKLGSLKGAVESEARKHLDNAKKDVTNRLKGLLGK